MSLSRVPPQIDELSRLAQIDLAAPEAARLSEELAEILLQHFQSLAATRPSEHQPALGHPATTRADQAVAGLTTSQAIRNAPAVHGSLILVPTVIPAA